MIQKVETFSGVEEDTHPEEITEAVNSEEDIEDILEEVVVIGSKKKEDLFTRKEDTKKETIEKDPKFKMAANEVADLIEEEEEVIHQETLTMPQENIIKGEDMIDLEKRDITLILNLEQ